MTQAQALAILKSGRNVFLTGSAGAGKTYVLNQYIQYLRERKVKVAVTASTGIAATHMNGMTIHAWSGIGVKSDLALSDLRRMKTKKYLTENLQNAKVLIIDEISMLHKTQIDLVDKVLRYFKENDHAFGNIQVVFSGDFFQLPPVGNQGETNRDKFAFMSQAWLDAGLAICYLTEQHRQTNNDLNGILNEIREGKLTDHSIKLLQAAQNNSLAEIDPPKLYSHNLDVDRINERHLLGLDTKSQSYMAKSKGNPKLVESLKKSASAPEKLRLKIGAKVMFSKNNYEQGYINGTLGVVEKYETEENYPVVKTLDGRKLTVVPNVWSVDDDKGSPLATLTQIPLKLAWAITVHKSQGMTLEAAEIDLSKTFERGQGYVALSRLKSIEGLRLLGFNSTALQVDSLALKADKRFQELSLEAEAEKTPKELEQLAITFLRQIEGLTDAKEIEKYKKRKKVSKKEKKSKKSTYLITKELVEDGGSIADIAQERALSEGTIMGHLLKIKELYPKVDISRFKPNDKLLKQVKTAKDTILTADSEALRPDGTVSQKALYDELAGTVTYQEIKLALVFIP